MTRGGGGAGREERDAFPFNCKARGSKEALSAIDPLSQALNALPARGGV